MLKTLLSLGEWVTEVIQWAMVSYASDGWLIEEMSAAVATMLECSGYIVVPSRCSAQRPQICLIVSPLVQPIGILSHTHITSSYIIHSLILSFIHSCIHSLFMHPFDRLHMVVVVLKRMSAAKTGRQYVHRTL